MLECEFCSQRLRYAMLAHSSHTNVISNERAGRDGAETSGSSYLPAAASRAVTTPVNGGWVSGCQK